MAHNKIMDTIKMRKFGLHRNRLHTAIGIILILLTSTILSCAHYGVPSLAEPLPFDDEVVHGTLDNGLEYYIRNNSTPQNRLFLELIVNVGSVAERDEERGIAHFLEHMAFKSTADFRDGTLLDTLAGFGIQLGPDVNAYTSFEETSYMLEVPTDDPEALRTALHIFQQWMEEIIFIPEEVETERLVILEEWRLRRGAQARLFDKQAPYLFYESLYANRLPIGVVETLETIGAAELERFYRQWYCPQSMAIVAVGDIVPQEIEDMLKNHLVSEKDPAPCMEPPIVHVPRHQETLYSIESDVESTSNMIGIYQKAPPTRLQTIGDYRDSFLHALFAIMLNARLREIGDDPQSPIARAGGGSGKLLRQLHVYSVGATLKDDDFEGGLETLIAELLRVQQHGFGLQEFDRAKSVLIGSYDNLYQGRNTFQSIKFIREYRAHFLEQEATPGIEYEYELVQRLLPNIMRSEVENLAPLYWNPDSRVIVANGIAQDEEPLVSESQLKEVVARSASLVLDPYEDQFTAQDLVPHIPQSGTIVEEHHDEETDIIEWKLSNGARVIIKQTDFQENIILMNAYSFGGLSLISDDDYFAGRYAVNIVTESGIGTFSRTDLEKLLAGTTISLTPYLREYSEGFQGSAPPDDLERMLQLLWLYFSDPRYDDEAASLFLEQNEQRAADRLRNPQQQFSEKFNALTTNDHMRQRILTAAQIAAIDGAHAYEIYKERFKDGDDFTFIFLGDIDIEQMRPLVAQWIASIPSDPANEQWQDVGVRRPQQQIKETLYAGIESQSVSTILFHGEEEYTLRNGHMLKTLTDALNVRFQKELREKLGGTYNVRVFSNIGDIPQGEYQVQLYFGSDPQRTDELVDTIFAIIADMKENLLDADTVTQLKRKQHNDYAVAIETNEFWLYTVREANVYTFDVAETLEYPQWIEEITAETIMASARRYLTDRYVQLTLYPEDFSN